MSESIDDAKAELENSKSQEADGPRNVVLRDMVIFPPAPEQRADGRSIEEGEGLGEDAASKATELEEKQMQVRAKPGRRRKKDAYAGPIMRDMDLFKEIWPELMKEKPPSK